MSALITDAEQGRCYITTRSLAEKGIKVTVAGENGHKNMAFYSKYCNNRILYPSPDENNANVFIKALMKVAKDYNVLIPLHERTIVPISKHLKHFKEITKIPIPHYRILRFSLNKAKTIKLAQQIGIPTPHTFFIGSLHELKSLSKNLEYPVVIKLTEEIFVGPPRYVYAYSARDLVTKYRIMHEKCSYPLIQELIPGTGYGFFTLFNESSEPLAIFCHKRIREYPITGGPSTCCESVYNPNIIKHGLNILKEIRWYGVAMVEFRLDHRDGKFKLMEINPRFWGSLPLAIASGVDFPYLLYQMAIGENVRRSTTYRIGIKCRFLSLDFLALKQALREANNKIPYLQSFFKSFFDKSVTCGDISLTDFGPTAYTLFMGFLKRMKRSPHDCSALRLN